VIEPGKAVPETRPVDEDLERGGVGLSDLGLAAGEADPDRHIVLENDPAEDAVMRPVELDDVLVSAFRLEATLQPFQLALRVPQVAFATELDSEASYP